MYYNYSDIPIGYNSIEQSLYTHDYFICSCIATFEDEVSPPRKKHNQGISHTNACVHVLAV